MKVLGFVFGPRPTVQPHIDHLCTKFRARVWILRHLRKSISSNEEMTRLYSVLVLPVLDYAAMVYHSQLNKEQIDCLENLQFGALKITFGFGHSRAELLEASGLETLWERREKLVDKFLQKLVKNERFSDRWFPQKVFHHMDLRKELFTKRNMQERTGFIKAQNTSLEEGLMGASTNELN